ncbi:MAG: hypothetical protein ACTHLT_15600 [Devosia sp.]
MTVIDMDVNDPATWDPALDAVLAAPENHQVLYEDDNIRVVSVSIAPGAIEKPHHHRWPSVFVIDSMIRQARDFDANGKQIPLPVPTEFEPPLIAKMAPQPTHYVANDDTYAFHGTRIEFKRGYAGDRR